MSLHGFDPLNPFTDFSSENESSKEMILIFEETIKSTIRNILDSYTGYYDVFSEALQNGLDATQKKYIESQKNKPNLYTPKIWIFIDIRNKIIRIIDNGIGMTENEFKFCVRPNVSFKIKDNLRGNKGVGATYLAYGFNYIHLQTKRGELKFSAILRQGRQWVEDVTNKIERPKFEERDYDVPELENEESGTCIEIRLTGGSGEKPKDLGWHGATTAQQWFDIFRIVTPLGGVYLTTSPFKPKVYINIKDRSGVDTEYESDNVEYYYPHEIPGLKVASLTEIRNKIKSIEGDPQTILQRLPDQFKNLDCMYEVWDHDQLLSENSYIKMSLTEDQKKMIEQHKVAVYAAHVDSVKTFDSFNENLGIRKDVPIMSGGLQLASNNMPQGPLYVIPLKRFIGYQRNTRIIVHFSHGAPDLGRKTFQPEFQELAELLAVNITNVFINYRWLLKPDTGSTKALTPSKELHLWKRNQEDWRDQNSASFDAIKNTIGYMSIPREEQDVIALFHEMIGADIIRGLKFYSTEYNEKYDGLFELHYTSREKHLFNNISNPLGVRNDIELPYESEPKVIEYKFDFDALIRDLDKDIKFSEHIDLVVCWTATGNFKDKIVLKSFLLDEMNTTRICFGSTHNAFFVGQYAHPVFEVIILEDLYKYLLNSEEEKANQKIKYNNL